MLDWLVTNWWCLVRLWRRVVHVYPEEHQSVWWCARRLQAANWTQRTAKRWDSLSYWLIRSFDPDLRRLHDRQTDIWNDCCKQLRLAMLGVSSWSALTVLKVRYTRRRYISIVLLQWGWRKVPKRLPLSLLWNEQCLPRVRLQLLRVYGN